MQCTSRSSAAHILMWPSLLLGTCLLLLIARVAVATDPLLLRCDAHPLCRELYRTGDHIDARRFKAWTTRHATGATTRLANGDAESDLELARLIIARLTLDTQRCPPNTYWHWSVDNSAGTCKCFVDRNCKDDIAMTTAATGSTSNIATPTLHIVITSAFAILVFILILVRIIYTPIGFLPLDTTQRSSKRI